MADGEGARRQHVVGGLLQGFEIGAAHPGDFDDLVEAQSLGFTGGSQQFGQVETIGPRPTGRRLAFHGCAEAVINPLIGIVLDHTRGRFGTHETFNTKGP